MKSVNSTDHLRELENYGVGWFVDIKYNNKLDKSMAILYTEKQKQKDKCEKVFIYDTVEEAIEAAHKWKVIDRNR